MATGGVKEVGGWHPVVHGRRKQVWRCEEIDRKENAIYTVFDDNIPRSMTPKGLYSLFGKFGVISDVFIPNKIRKVTKTRFGFVRYDCRVAVTTRKSTFGD